MSAASREEHFFSELPDLPPELLAFAKHYLALPREGVLPTLSSFLDSPPFKLMPGMVIVDVLSAEDYRIRYFGTAMVELVGKDFTGVSALESRAAGLEIHLGTRAWSAATYPCGYFSKRTIYRQRRPPQMEAVFEVLTLTLPVLTKSSSPCILNYSTVPRMAADQHVPEAAKIGYRITPICWVDIGAGVPAAPI